MDPDVSDKHLQQKLYIHVSAEETKSTMQISMFPTGLDRNQYPEIWHLVCRHVVITFDRLAIKKNMTSRFTSGSVLDIQHLYKLSCNCSLAGQKSALIFTQQTPLYTGCCRIKNRFDMFIFHSKLVQCL